MFEIPSNHKIAKCIITKETVLNHKEPEVVIDESRKIPTNNSADIRKARPKPKKETA
jgi:ATP-dependent protease Clp ATPase subunit